jgi:hypothetical protein
MMDLSPPPFDCIINRLGDRSLPLLELFLRSTFDRKVFF